LVFSRQAYVPSWCIPERVTIVPPSIDAFSPKNIELDDSFVRSTLVHTGLVAGPLPKRQSSRFIRTDGTPGRVERRAEVVRSGEPPQWETPLIVQVSRWDPLKDMKGVMLGFARMLEQSPEQDAALLLAGPDVRSVGDDPEAPEVFEETVTAWRALPDEIREHVHLVLLPMDDVEENAAIVNALQRHAAIVVQKSLKEGFGLTVTEAMWKARPMIASRVGGIQDQVEDGVHGILLDDPSDLDALAQAMRRLLDDPAARRRMGDAARQRVREEFLGARHLLAYAALFERLLASAR
jgi:trehalose synthase